MQAGSLTVLTGGTPATLTPASRATLTKDLVGLEVIHPETEYDVVTRFEGNGACSDWKQTKVDFTSRKKPANGFTQGTTTTNFIKLHATQYPFDLDYKFDYWFGFASAIIRDTAQVFEAIGKTTGGGPHLHVWYGAAIMTRVIKEIGPGGAVIPKGTRTHYFASLTSQPDSAKLQTGLLNPWRGYKDNDTQTVSFKVQMLKVTYDSIQPAVGVRATKVARPGSALQAVQNGNSVLITHSAGRAVPAGALGLFNMLGHKVATLHPTGYAYQWNGRTAAGEEAQTGVYFVQSGSRVLGKFFYSR